MSTTYRGSLGCEHGMLYCERCDLDDAARELPERVGELETKLAQHKQALEKIMEECQGTRPCMEDSFSWEFTCRVENITREALGLPTKKMADYNES